MEDRIQEQNFECPISRQLMFDPVLASDGRTYERESIEKVLSPSSPRSPMTSKPLTQELRPNIAIRELIAESLRRHPKKISDLYIPEKLPQQLLNLLCAGEMDEVQRLLKLAREELLALKVQSQGYNLWQAAVVDPKISFNLLLKWYRLLQKYPVLWKGLSDSTTFQKPNAGTVLEEKLMQAVKQGEGELAKILLQMGADKDYVSTKDSCEKRRTLLQTALYYHHNDLFRELLRLGCSQALENSTHYSLLHLAVMYKDAESVKLLLLLGADVHAQGCDGNTPLHLAMSNQVDEEIISLLIVADADYKCPNAKGETPLDMELQSERRVHWKEMYKDRKQNRWSYLLQRLSFLEQQVISKKEDNLSKNEEKHVPSLNKT